MTSTDPMPQAQDSAPPSDALAPARDAAFLKLGRNIVLFHQLESGLKAFYGLLVVEGLDEEGVAAARSKRETILQTHSLGRVVQAVFDELTYDPRSVPPEPAAVGGRPAVCFRFGQTGPEIDAQKAALDALVQERNRLVHRVTDDYDLRTANGIASFDALLDPQAERIRLQLHALQARFDDLAKARRRMADVVGSSAFRNSMEQAVLRGSSLIRGMADLAHELARPDGWAVLHQASNVLRARDPSAFADLHARFGRSGLKQLLIASGEFDLRDEPTPHGVRVVYRTSPDPS